MMQNNPSFEQGLFLLIENTCQGFLAQIVDLIDVGFAHGFLLGGALKLDDFAFVGAD